MQQGRLPVKFFWCRNFDGIIIRLWCPHRKDLVVLTLRTIGWKAFSEKLSVSWLYVHGYRYASFKTQHQTPHTKHKIRSTYHIQHMHSHAHTAHTPRTTHTTRIRIKYMTCSTYSTCSSRPVAATSQAAPPDCRYSWYCSYHPGKVHFGHLMVWKKKRQITLHGLCCSHYLIATMQSVVTKTMRRVCIAEMNEFMTWDY